jgi:hypothetical protein
VYARVGYILAPLDFHKGSSTRRAQLGHPRTPSTIIAPRNAGAHKNGGESGVACRNACKRLRAPQRMLASRARGSDGARFLVSRAMKVIAWQHYALKART